MTDEQTRDQRRRWTLGLIALLVTAPASALAGQNGEEIRTAEARQQETGFGNLVADGIRKATRAEIAWVAGGEFRETTLRAEAGQPFLTILDDPEDPLVVLSLRGETVRQALEWSLQQYPKPGKAFLHVSGMQVSVSVGRASAPRVRNVVCGGRPLAPEQVYRVGMTRTMAVGSFGFFRLWPDGKTARPEAVTLGEALREVLANGALKARRDGRMAVLTSE